MSRVKKLYISVLVCIITILFICFIILDISRFLGVIDYYGKYFPSAVLKRITVVLAAAIAWAAGNDGIGKKDTCIMSLVFTVICAAETAFLLRRFIAGVALFGVCQSLLTARNGRGLIKELKLAGCSEKLKAVSIAGVILAALVLTVIISYQILGIRPEIVSAWIYGAVLSASLWAGLANYILRLFPLPNSMMVAVGMFCFYCCDILVGLDAVMEVSFPWLIVNSLIWVFYTPAITLLALSCYNYKELPD